MFFKDFSRQSCLFKYFSSLCELCYICNLANLHVQYASNSASFPSSYSVAMNDREPTPGSHMQNEPLVCFNDCGQSCWLLHFSMLHFNKIVDIIKQYIQNCFVL